MNWFHVVSLKLCMGASAGMGILMRNEAGICKHLNVVTRWIQECSNKKNIIGHRISREEIPAYALASASSANDLIKTHEHCWDNFSISFVISSHVPALGFVFHLSGGGGVLTNCPVCWQMFIE